MNQSPPGGGPASRRPPRRVAAPVTLCLAALFVIGCGDGGRKSGAVSERDVKDVERILAQKSAQPDADARPPVTLPPGTHFAREDVPNEGGYLQIPLVEITDAQADRFLRRLKTEYCTCNCPHTIDQCLIDDPACTTAHTLALQILREVTTDAK